MERLKASEKLKGLNETYDQSVDPDVANVLLMQKHARLQGINPDDLIEDDQSPSENDEYEDDRLSDQYVSI